MSWNSGQCDSGSCVAVKIGSAGVVVWDAKDTNVNGDLLVFNHEEWRAFIADVKEGKYDI